MAANGPLLTLQWLPCEVRQSPKAFQSLKYRGTSHLVSLGLHPAQPEMAQPQGETLSEMCTHMITMLSCSTPLQVRETMV